MHKLIKYVIIFFLIILWIISIYWKFQVQDNGRKKTIMYYIANVYAWIGLILILLFRFCDERFF